MDVDQKIPWPRIAVEGTAIVASILLAFSIDAWWSGKQQHEAEQIVLQNLLDDLQDKQELLAEMTRFSQAIVESAESLLRVAAGSEDKPSNDTSSLESSPPDNTLQLYTWWESNEACSGTKAADEPACAPSRAT